MITYNYSPWRAFIYMAVVLSVLVVQSSAVAGIAEFNANIKNGDFKAAATEATVVWESYDKSKSAAPIVAREFAFISYLAEDFVAAKTFIDELVDPNSELSSRDEQAGLSRILADLIALRLDNGNRQRNQLMDSLKTRIAASGFDNIALIAAEFLYNEDWRQARWSDASASAALAAELCGLQGSSLIERKHRAELIRVASGFLVKRDGKMYDQMVDLHDAIVVDVDSTQDSGQREKLIRLKWVAHAWANSIEALFQSYYSQTGSQINTDIKPRALRQSEYGYFYEFSNIQTTGITDFRPPCEVTFDDGKLRYPHSEAFRGTVGSVIVKMNFDDKGKGSEATLLAVVPTNHFAENVLKAAPSFRLEPKRGQDTDKCRLGRNDVIVPIIFVVQ